MDIPPTLGAWIARWAQKRRAHVERGGPVLEGGHVDAAPLEIGAGHARLDPARELVKPTAVPPACTGAPVQPQSTVLAAAPRRGIVPPAPAIGAASRGDMAAPLAFRAAWRGGQARLLRLLRAVAMLIELVSVADVAAIVVVSIVVVAIVVVASLVSIPGMECV